MGYRIARACLGTHDPPLSATAQVVLMRMAWAVLDKPTGDKPAGEYWAGWEYLGLTLASTNQDANRRAVTRALTELVAKGYVKPLGSAHLGQRQRYQITVDW